MTKALSKQILLAENEGLAEDLRDVMGAFVRAVRARAGTPSDAQSETLAYLERSGPVSIAALADSRGVKHQSMRLVIANLEAAALVTLMPDVNDRRGYLVNLTKAGLAMTIAAKEARTRWIAEALVATLTSRERKTLEQAVPLLRRIADLS